MSHPSFLAMHLQRSLAGGEAMDVFMRLFGLCTLEKADNSEKDASDMQLSAFEYRQYQTRLEPSQQRLVERVVNQWVAMLVKGMVMRVNGFEEKTFLDRDLLNLELGGELYPLEALCRVEMFKESDDEIVNLPWVVELTFDFEDGETILAFAFDRERHRLQFALTLRVLRTRNAHLNLSGTFEVLNRDEDEDEDEGPSFHKMVTSNRYDVQGAGISVIISVGTLKINQHLRCNNRHVYLEFFSDYPRRDKFLYARSSYNNLPGTVLADSENKRELKDQEKSGADPDGKRNRGDQALCKINFDMKNVKMKIPKVPFTIHGRLMAKDDFFPTAVANFELAITKAHLQDRRDSNSPKNPEAVDLPLLRAWKNDDGPEEVAVLGLRFIGIVTEEMERKKNNSGARRNASNADGSGEAGSDEDEEEEEEEEDEEAEDSEEESDENQEPGGTSSLQESGSKGSELANSSNSSAS
ncbi:unnamed protein product [Effrenium voratum]|uniref:Uncharacterized protein n=2 Tax=Effrenium voratum TaxID=2562239 RepID=A0AA36HWK7_9DINO|nr:unnamed protein product [Effrenium voratum]